MTHWNSDAAFMCVYTRRHHHRYETQQQRGMSGWDIPDGGKEGKKDDDLLIFHSVELSWTFIKFNCPQQQQQESLSQVGNNHNFLNIGEGSIQKKTEEREIYYPFICFVLFCFLLREGDVFCFERERAETVRDRIRHWVMSQPIYTPATTTTLPRLSIHKRFLFLFLIFIYRSLLLLPKLFFFLNDSRCCCCCCCPILGRLWTFGSCRFSLLFEQEK